MPDDVVIARALHVLAVAHWIGGVAFVTLVILPLARANGAPELFEAVERRFARQVRVSVPLVGLTGLWMCWRLDLWRRFAEVEAWWMTAMLAIWLVFMLMLFVIEPLAHARLAARLQRAPATVLLWSARVHLLLLTLAAVTILGAVAGVHGGVF